MALRRGCARRHGAWCDRRARLPRGPGCGVGARPARHSTFVAVRRASDSTGLTSAPQLIKAGEASWNRLDSSGRNRFGDYAIIDVDSVDRGGAGRRPTRGSCPWEDDESRYGVPPPQRSAAFFAAGNAAALAALLRSGQVHALVPPDEPQLVSVVQAAARHEALYRGAQRGDFAPSASPGSISAEERAVALFRRAERRLWTAVQQPHPPAPPGEFLGPAPPDANQ